MKNLFSFLIFFVFALGFSQEKYLTKNGTLNFEASVPSFEEVKATSNSVTAILNTENGEFASLALIKGFRFKNALMEEHFNENYIESDTYPKAIFKGKLLDFNINELKKNYTITGTLILHGQTKELELTAAVTEEDDIIIISASFVVKPEDFAIKIPKVVSKKIAEEIQVSFNFRLAKK